jgi:hypothetical protein
VSDSPRARKSNIQRIRYGDRHVKKEKDPKCWTCGSMPWRVKGIRCKACGLLYEDEGPIEVPFSPLKSYLGVDDK